ncbi:MAG TPA: Rieske 2Fe-2S domain-containing protein [Candidatus Polarisedimenticolia bacterium]|nr:Rieske 2Fe-2S domain-containing protein [Candidatus Polarisedimenticolia bacterium]
MPGYVRVAAVSEVPEGTGKALHVSGRPIALFNVKGIFHAVEGLCPHRGGPLGEGYLSGSVVTCPWHFWQFDVATGRAPDVPDACLATFRVKVDGDGVFVEV